ncbi:MAG: hypothetical protein JJE17_00560 [Peptostreptococcaceae bacterium]|nr:hypothetical protein [Peptostreptococcaceae bacterium]
MVNKESRCPICSNGAYVEKAPYCFGKYISCPQCGFFEVENSLFDDDIIEPKIKSAIYYYLTQIAPLSKGVNEYCHAIEPC